MTVILSRTPVRISFFGGGSDYPAWLEQEAGAVLSTTINQYLYISARYLPYYSGVRHRIVWRHVELVDSISEILHPAVRNGLRYLNFTDENGVEIHYQADLPARSGLGSSSSFIVGLLNSLNALRGTEVKKEFLALQAIDLEQNYMNEVVGNQDQVAAAYGGLNKIVFLNRNAFNVSAVHMPIEREKKFQSHLLLFSTGKFRNASAVAAEITKKLNTHKENIRRLIEMVDEGISVLRGGDISGFGWLLDEAWRRKKEISEIVSNSYIDDIYDRAKKAGAVGGKLLGAGNGGFILFFVSPERHAEVIKSLSPKCVHVPFEFDDDGSTIVYNSKIIRRSK